jgi:hypothetical protein
LGVHAAMLGMSRSDVIADLIRTHCRRFVISDRERPAEQGGDVEAA